MSSNKFLDDYRYIKDNKKYNGNYLINEYNNYNDNDLLRPLSENVKKIIKIWDISLLDTRDYTIEQLCELFQNETILKNIDIELCFDFLYSFRINSKNSLNNFLEKIKTYEAPLNKFLSSKIKNCIDNKIYICDRIVNRDNFKRIEYIDNFDSLYYSIFIYLYYTENEELPNKNGTINSLSIWNNFNIVNRYVNVNGYG